MVRKNKLAVHKVVGIVLLALLFLAVGCGGGSSQSQLTTTPIGALDEPGNTSPEPMISHPEMPPGGETTLEEALYELSGLPTPNGVDAELFKEMKDILRTALVAQGTGRFTSITPTNDGNAVKTLAPIFADETSITLSWQEVNHGDYNLDGEVGVADLTQIALYFTKSYRSEEWVKAKVADGDGNGEVNLADITPIAINYMHTINGYKVFRSVAGEDVWTQLEAIGRPSASLMQLGLTEVAVVYTHEDEEIEAGVEYEYRVAPYDEDLDIGVRSITITASATSTYGIDDNSYENPVESVSIPDSDEQVNSSQLTVRYTNEPTTAELFELVYGELGGDILGRISGTNSFRVNVSSSIELIKTYGHAIGDVEIGYVHLMRSEYTDPARYDDWFYCLDGDPDQWGLYAVNCEDAWNYSTGENTIICVIDSGLDQFHPDFANQVQYAHRIGGEAWDTDDIIDGHGTKVSGAAIAKSFSGETNPGSGIVGLACGAKIGVVKIGYWARKWDWGNREWEYYWTYPEPQLIEAIYWASSNARGSNKADVINISLGGHFNPDPDLEASINFAVNNGVFVVASAGNENQSADNHYPSAIENCFSVGACGEWWGDYTRAEWSSGTGSNYGSKVDLCAPGTRIKTTIPYTNDWDRVNGTSIATPIVAAAAALLRAYAPSIQPNQIKTVLTNTGYNMVHHDPNKSVGRMLDIGAALQSIAGDPPDIQVPVRFKQITLEPGESGYVDFNIGNASSASGDLDWEATDNRSWITGLDPSSVTGQHPGQTVGVNVYITAPGSEGQYDGVVTITSNDLDEPTIEVDIELTVEEEVIYHTLYGYIRETNNDAVNGVTVSLPGHNPVSTGHEGVDGRYRFTEVADGYYSLGYSKTDWQFDPTSPQNIDVDGGDVEVPVIEAFPPITDFTVSGDTDEGWVDVTIRDSSNQFVDTITSDSGGDWDYTLSPGSYSAAPEKEGWRFTPSSRPFDVIDQNVGNINFTAYPNTASGVVTSSRGGGAGNVLIQISGSWSGSAYTAPNGTWSISEIPNGNYTVTGSKPGWHLIPSSRSLSIEDDGATVSNFTATPNTVTGYVTRELGGSLTGVHIEIDGPAGFDTYTEPDGTWSFEELPNGNYSVTASKDGWWFSFSSGSSFSITDNNVSFDQIIGRASMAGITINGVTGDGEIDTPFILNKNQTYTMLIDSVNGNIGHLCTFDGLLPFYRLQGTNVLETFEFGPKTAITVTRDSPSPGDPAEPITFYVKVWTGG